MSAAREIGAVLELVLVPHEPSAEALQRIDAACTARWGRGPILWSDLASGAGQPLPADPPVPLVVDTVGMLADLYVEADLALVGGAFDATGLHSVIEPAAAGLPVLFGPLHDRREANDLLAVGGAEVVTPQNATELISALILDPDRMLGMGRAAASYVRQGSGAAEGNAELVSELVDLGLSRRSPTRA
jgi:3-deoxy-D-manno-octulosonic-acid transferase